MSILLMKKLGLTFISQEVFSSPAIGKVIFRMSARPGPLEKQPLIYQTSPALWMNHFSFVGPTRPGSVQTSTLTSLRHLSFKPVKRCTKRIFLPNFPGLKWRLIKNYFCLQADGV